MRIFDTTKLSQAQSEVLKMLVEAVETKQLAENMIGRCMRLTNLSQKSRERMK